MVLRSGSGVMSIPKQKRMPWGFGPKPLRVRSDWDGSTGLCQKEPVFERLSSSAA